MMSQVKIPFLLMFVFVLHNSCIAQHLTPAHTTERTTFQTGSSWRPELDVRSDAVMVYGIGASDVEFKHRVKSWKDKGYRVHFMTGISWGGYQDYFNGKFDGKKHYENSQVNIKGDTIWHNPGTPYVVPTASYSAYIKTLVKRAIDAGVAAIFLEEPEFWTAAGYSDAFKAEWQNYYGTAWVAQHTSPEATYLSSKLKYQLYFNVLKDVFSYIKTYSKANGLDVKCYVPTHSLLNYTSWGIVSPQASLAQLDGMDGYIAQVWTGTARVANWFNGKEKERVFENAFLEYGSMISMVEPTGRKMFLLTDPVEDAVRTWDDYKRNYQATYTAQLMYPKFADYQVMPWPERIYLGKYKLEHNDVPQPISPEYAAQMQVMVNTLNNIPVSDHKLNGSQGIGVLMANSIMFQRFPVHDNYSDPGLSNFYGMVLPLLKRGIPIGTVHMENLGWKNALKDIKVLIMSYTNMKPISAASHAQLAEWVKKGGILIYCGRDDDPFQDVKEWWNSDGLNYKTPIADLYQKMNVVATGRQDYKYGKGTVYVLNQNPKEFVLEQDGDREYWATVSKAYATIGDKLMVKNNFYLERGPYTIASVMNESVSDHPLLIKGNLIDLFDPKLPILKSKTVLPGQQAFLYSIDRITNKNKAQVLCAGARIYNEVRRPSSYSFITKAPLGTPNVMRIYLPKKPLNVELRDSKQNSIKFKQAIWDALSSTYFLEYDNSSDGIKVSINIQ